MPVNATHPLYRKQLPKWELVRSVIDNDAGKFILDVDPNDLLRSKKYRNDAILSNFTKLTLNGLIGLVFRKESVVDLPSAIEYIKENANGEDVSLESLLQQIMMEILKTGRCGLLAELPEFDPDEVNSIKMSVIKPYASETIINWRYKPDGNSKVLSLVVLKESIEVVEGDDVFESCQREQFRALRLDDNGFYYQQIYNYKYELISEIQPLDYNGLPLLEIPFVFIGSESNNANCDPIPLYDLAILNLGHYKNSADYEESIFINGQPTVFLSTEVNQDEFKLAYPNGIKFGSRAGYNLGPNGQAQLLQANPNQLADVAMRRKEEMAVALGARLISPAGGRETAEAARIRFGAQNSSLQLVTYNISIGIEEILNFISLFMQEVPEPSNVQLNTEFYEDTADPLLIAQQLMLLDRGVIAMTDLRENLRDVGVISLDRSDEELDAEAEVIDPLVGVSPPNGNQTKPKG